VEANIAHLFDNNISGVFNDDELLSLKSLEGGKKVMSDKEELEWRLKSRTIWPKEGDNNTKFFHKFVICRKNLNTTWEMDLLDGLLFSKTSQDQPISFSKFVEGP